MGEKIAIVSRKPQTTRNRIYGVVNRGDTQYILLDTPGLHKARSRLGDYMVKVVRESLAQVEAALLLVEPIAHVGEPEKILLERIREEKLPCILCINKIDTVEKKDDLLAVIAAYSAVYPDFDAIIPISARTGDGLDELMAQLAKYAVPGPQLFPDGMTTDQPDSQVCAEIVREKMLRCLDKEIPHGTAVEVTRFTERDNGIIDLDVTIYCEKASHKGIIIGKHGDMLKHISTLARQDIEKFMGTKVYMETWVKVKENWRDNVNPAAFFSHVGKVPRRGQHTPIQPPIPARKTSPTPAPQLTSHNPAPRAHAKGMGGERHGRFLGAVLPDRRAGGLYALSRRTGGKRMQQAKTVTSGLVLRQTLTKETDLILTVLTPDLGKIPVIARGARRKNSRLAAACQLLAYSELTVYQKGAWYMLDEASTIELFDGVRQDFENLALASFFAELTESVAEEGSPAPELLRLLLNALYALGVLHKEPLLVCGRPEPEKPMLDVVHGIVHCAACKQPGGLSLPLTQGALAALRHILYCPDKKLYSFTLERPALRQLDHAAEALTAAQLERSFRTLDYYKSIFPTEVSTYE